MSDNPIMDPRIGRFASHIVHIDLLYACDLDCSHCYLSVRQAKGLTKQRYLDLIDEAYDAGFFQVTFSGGEIFLRKDTLEIIAHARRKRMLVRLITHAGRITDAVADRLAELGVHQVGVSFYSMVPEDHEAVTRTAGSHANTVAGIRRLRDRDISVELKISVMPENQASWPTAVTFGEELGCDVFIGSAIFAKDDLDIAHIDAMNVDFAERVKVERIRLERELAKGKSWERVSPDAPEEDLCGAGNFSAFVDPFGKVFPCAVFYEPAGDLADGTFEEIWRGSQLMNDVRDMSKSKFHECQGCGYLDDCHQCLALNFMHTGDMAGRSTVQCATTHARFTAAHEMGLHPEPVAKPEHLFGLRPPSRPPCAGGPGAGTDAGCTEPSTPRSPSVSELGPVPNILEMAQGR